MYEATRLLLDMTYLLLIAGVCSIIFSRLRLPPIIGYLAAGIIIGPTILGDISVEEGTIELLSNLGIVLLMFSIGLNLNLKKLRQFGSYILILVALQMPFMVVVGYLVGLAIGLDSVGAIFLGAVISGTSTAVVVAVLHGREGISDEIVSTAITITIMEDIGQVLILSMAAPLLVGDTPALGSIVLMVVSIVVFMATSILVGIRVIPRLLNWIGRDYPPEVLLIVSLGLCFAMALISDIIGLSIAIGAFIMGLIVSQAARAKEVEEKVGPMKEVFMSVFFISIGIQIVPAEIINNLDLVLIIASVFILAKIVSVTVASYLLRGDPRTAFLTSICLVAMGEFAFIIAKTALDAGVVDQQFYASIIGAALVTMLALPILSKVSDGIYSAVARITPRWFKKGMWKFDRLRDEVRVRATTDPQTQRALKWELVLVFIDLLTIVLVQTMFYGLIVPMNLLPQPSGAFTIPGLFTLLLSMLLMLPALINMFQGVKRMAVLLARNGQAPLMATGRGQRLYRTFRNHGEGAAILLVVFLFLPFLAEAVGVPTSIWIGIGAVIVMLAVMSVRTYRYVRRCERSERKDTERNLDPLDACPPDPPEESKRWGER